MAGWDAVGGAGDSDLRCFCGAKARLVRGRWGPFYSCSTWPQCDGAVGCHPDTDVPLGRMADSDTRAARRAAHDAFDPIWKRGRGIGIPNARGIAYDWLVEELGVAHIGEASLEEAERIRRRCNQLDVEWFWRTRGSGQ